MTSTVRTVPLPEVWGLGSAGLGSAGLGSAGLGSAGLGRAGAGGHPTCSTGLGWRAGPEGAV